MLVGSIGYLVRVYVESAPKCRLFGLNFEIRAFVAAHSAICKFSRNASLESPIFAMKDVIIQAGAVAELFRLTRVRQRRT